MTAGPAAAKHAGSGRRRINGQWVPIPLVGLGGGSDYESKLAAGKVPLQRGALIAALTRPGDGSRAIRVGGKSRLSGAVSGAGGTS